MLIQVTLKSTLIKKTINIDKEIISSNKKRNRECITVFNQQCNQRHTDDNTEYN